MENRIQIENLVKKFHRKTVLNNISCTFVNGVYGILGPNGAGKTTMMRCITGLYQYKGIIKMNGQYLSKIRKNQIGYLPQRFGLFPELTVNEMMTYFCNLKKLKKSTWEMSIQNSLEMVNLTEQRRCRINTLSGGMVRRLGIAQAFLGDAKVILLDEPTAGLDPEERMRFKNIITNASKDKIILVSTHIVEDVEACCNHIMILNIGEKIFMGTNEQLIEHANGRIMEVEDKELDQNSILFVEKSYIRNSNKLYRIITKEQTEKSIQSSVEDGYLCLLKER